MYEVLLKYISPANPIPWYDEPYHSSLLEIACQMKKRDQFVKILLDKSADPNVRYRATGMPLIHVTAWSGNLHLLQTLLRKKKIDLNGNENLFSV